jgi:hypothetical protein
MSAEALLSRLVKVRKTGSGRWLACCPAHDDKTPSLSICEKSDGRVLIHCFGGCDPLAVLQAADLDWSAVMPPDMDHARGNASQIPAKDVLAAISGEAVVMAHLSQKAAVDGLSASERHRLDLAVDRVLEARRIANV